MSEQRGLSLPAAPPATPGLPSNFVPIAFERFTGLNTKPARPAIADTEMFWSNGWMPIAESTLRTLYGIGEPIVTAPPGTIIWFGFGNIADTKYCVVLNTNGSLTWVNTDTMFTGGILAPGVILDPRTIFGFSQWGSQYLIFAADQINGYWLFDGNSTFGAGTISPFVDITNSGSDYTSAPSIALHTTGSGSGVGFSVQIDHGTVSLITVTNPGVGFAIGDLATLTFSGGGSDTQAIVTANLSAGGGVTGITITNPGSGYTFAATVSIQFGGGVNATGVLNIQNGQIISATVLNPGESYTSPPNIVISDPGYGTGGNHVNGGTGASGFATVGSNGLFSFTVNNGGSGYTSVPTVVIVGDGTGAAGVATIAGGVVTGVNLTNPGQGYTKALVEINGGNDAANASITLMPFGVSGTTVEVYQQHVWVGNGGANASFPPRGRIIFSSPGNPADFNPANGAGAFLATDSFLRVGYYSLKQSNGFLYLVGDSSMNYISGVSTSSAPATSTTPAGPPITTFGNQNVDPQLGSPWPSSVQVFSRNIVFANTIGVFVSYGGAVTKVSEPLDGVYTSSLNLFTNQDFPSAVANIFGIPVYMLLIPFTDPTNQAPTVGLMMWTGKKWFTCVPDGNTLTYIASQEINSVLTAWGSDGTSIYPLFHQPSNFNKTVQSKLFSTPAYWTTKTAVRAHAVVKVVADDEQQLNLTIDNEVANGTGSAALPLTPVDNANVDVLGPYPCGQAGRMIGVTVQTLAGDVELLSIGITEQVESTNI